MQEFWVNNQQDWQEFQSYLRENKFDMVFTEEGPKEKLFVSGDMKVHIPNEFIPKTDSPKYDKLIFGKNNLEEVVNITIEEGVAHIYCKNGEHIKLPYKPWMLSSTWIPESRKLKGHQPFKYMKEVSVDRFIELQSDWNPRTWLPRTLEEGFMMKHGYTYYKGMTVDQVSVLSFDIEATGLDKTADNAFIPLLGITYRDRKGQKTRKLFDIFDYDDEELFWQEINQFVQDCDPDIILGHNILSYDLPYADTNSIGLNWGRDGSRIKFDKKESKYRRNQQQQYKYYDVNCHGRDVIDTFFLSMKYDIGNNFNSYGLKSLEKELGIVTDDRSWDWKNWPVQKLIDERRKGTELGFKMWNKFREYCEGDSDSPIALFDLMIPAFFYLSQSVPKTLQKIINHASGSQLDNLMIRSYIQDGYSLPKSTKKEPFMGAISMGVPGLYDNVRKVDVASLYPSIMLQYKIYDRKKDPQNNMLQMLTYFRDERLRNKKLAKETGNKYYDDLQAAQKNVINSMYGFLGAKYLLFNYPQGAADVTRYGREILLKGVEWATGHTLKRVVKEVKHKGEEDEKEKYEWVIGDKVAEGLGYTLVNVDTDSFSYTNGKAPSSEEFDKEIQVLNSLYPELIRWEKDGKTGIMEQLLVIKAKNYVLLEGEKRKYKGSSITDQKKEPVLIEFIHKFIDNILDSEDVHDPRNVELYKEYCKKTLDVKDITPWLTKKTISKSILSDKADKRANEQKPMDAILEAVDRGVIEGYQEGDKIWLYQYIRGQKQKMEKGEPKFYKRGNKKKGINPGDPVMVDDTALRFPELFEGNYDKWHYVERVFKTVCIFQKLVNIDDYIDYNKTKNRELLLNECS